MSEIVKHTQDSNDSEPQPTCCAQKWQPNEEAYIGTKVIRAMPMDEITFLRTIKGVSDAELQNRETQGDGYKVTYEDGYVYWSPKRVFDFAYRKISTKEHGLIWRD